MAADLKLITDNLDLWTSALLTKSTAGRGSNGKVEAYGIKKLRALILELAVRGKLVPQDAGDEPASVLLTKIVKEKARLIKEGVIKKQSPLAEIEEVETPFNVPDGWIWQRLGEIGYTQTGGTPNKTNKEYFGSDIPFIKPGDIYPNYVDYNNEGLSREGHLALGRSAPANSILMVCIGTIGKCNSINRPCAFNQQINSITPYIPMAEFLLKAMSSNYFQTEAWQRSSSTTIAILNKGKWNDIIVPLPPLAEQHRIVAKVDELMALCDQLEQQQTSGIEAHQTLVATLLATLTTPVRPEPVEGRVTSQPSTLRQAQDERLGDNNSARTEEEFAEAWSRIADHFDTLFTTEQSIDQLKQTILQLAVMGKLVPQDPNDEPAGVLLESEAFGGRASEKAPFDSPAGWLWRCIDDLSPEFQNGASSRGDKKGKEIVVLRLADIENGRVSLADTRLLIISEQSIGKYFIDKNDILIIRVNGSADIVGRFILCNRKFDAIYCDHFIRMRFARETLCSDFLVLLGASTLLRSQIEVLFISTAGQKTVNQKHIGSLIVPIPPLAEQHRIVAKVDQLMALCDVLKRRLDAARITRIHLADAIVEQAVA